MTVDIGYLGPSQRTALRRERRANKTMTSRQLETAEDGHASQNTLRTSWPPCHISLYRDNKLIFNNHIFRDSRGQAVAGGLELSIADFVPHEGPVDNSSQLGSEADVDAENENDSGNPGQWSFWHPKLQLLTFTVPFAELCESVSQGEKRQEREERTPPRLFKTKAAAGKQRRDGHRVSEDQAR